MRLLHVAATACVAMAACVSDTSSSTSSSSQGDTGQLSLALAGQAPSGAHYRLRHADLTITGAIASMVFHSDEHLDQPTVTAHLPTGPYTISLAAGWSLERVDPDGTSREVQASLASPNPQAFDITSGAFTPVALRFLTSAETVDLSHGDVGVSVTVDDAPGNGTQAIVVDDPVRLTEGLAGSFAIRLAAAPTSDVIVYATSADPRVATVITTAVVIHRDDWFQHHLIRLTAGQDSDIAPGATAVTLTSTTISGITVPVAIDDDDPQIVDVDAPDFGLLEGETTQVNVTLGYRPATPQTVTVTSESPLLIAEPATLTFTADNFDQPQPVTLRSPPDSVVADTLAIVRLTVSAPVAQPSYIVVTILDQLYAVSHGYPTYGGQSEMIPANLVVFQPVDIAGSAVVLQALQLIASTAGQARMGIYSDNGNRPYALIAQTQPFTPDGIPALTSAQPGTSSLAPQRVWIGTVFNAEAEIGVVNLPGVRCAMPWSSALPYLAQLATCGDAATTLNVAVSMAH